MAFTIDPSTAPPIANPTGLAEFDLPTKEFIGYDPKGHFSITGTPIQKAPAPDPKQENVTEVPVESAVPEESIKLSPQLSALARKEQAARRRDQALTQREQSLADRLAKAEKYEQLQAKIAAKDYSAADDLGLSYDQYTQYLIDKEKGADPNEQRYRTLEERVKAAEKNQAEQINKEYQQNQLLWKAEIAKVVSENPEFSTIKELGLEDAVLQHVNDSFDEDDVELTAEQAAREIEKYALERAEKFASVSKIKSRAAEPPKVLGAPKSSPKTITQNMTVTSQAPSKKPMHLMSEAEQWAEATRRYQEERLRAQGR